MNKPNLHKYTRIEYERRFLLVELPAGVDPEQSFNRILDEYIEGTRLRLRRIESPNGDLLVAKLTQKFREPVQPPSQTTITNIYLNEAEYAALDYLRGSKISKRRYSYQNEEQDYSVDVFEDELVGLITCDVEAKDNDEIKSLQIPPFAIREVTDNPAFTGGELAKLSREELTQLLDTTP